MIKHEANITTRPPNWEYSKFWNFFEYLSVHPQVEAPTPPLLGGWIQYTEGIVQNYL